MDPRLLKEERARRALYAERERRRVDADRYNWKKHARAEQLPPPWKWRTWLILAGRGWGKTRSGAEWVRANYKTNQFINLIGATADDARDIMIEGETGVLAICPPDERPIYMPSKRRLEWPNGSISLIFTADEPERLRGKQHMRLWADELCFVAGTMVTTSTGDVAIERVRAGDLVLTRKGLRPVVRAWCTGTADVVRVSADQGSLTGTHGHPIWIVGAEDFVPLGDVRIGDKMLACRTSIGTGVAGTATSSGTTGTERASSCIGQFTNRFMVRFRRTLISTTGTETRAITNSQTSKRFRGGNTACDTIRPALPYGRVISEAGQVRQRGHLYNHIQRLVSGAINSISRQVNGIVFAAKSAGAAFAKPIPSCTPRFAPSATRSSCRESQGSDVAPSRARGTLLDAQSGTASFAAINSAPGTRARSAVRENVALSTDTVRKITPLGARPVYNIEVEGEHEYFANGFLCSNCSWKYPEAWDQAMLGLRIGNLPQVVVTTTPRPTKLIKELASNASTHVTQGTTYANRANLAPAFFDEIIKKYEGTRLGRQELDAEILTDNPAALWQRDKIDQTRVEKAPDMSRIVVAIDPAVTSTETSDLTGIVVVGLAGDHAYVLADASVSATPDAWARKALNAYHDTHADLIVAETNNGGDLVETVLRTVDRNVPYKKVHASRGKQIRAEPIAALYEQGRVHHVGSFPELEDQMCEFDPTASQKSPDRMDALVWALSELTQGPSRKGIVTELRI